MIGEQQFRVVDAVQFEHAAQEIGLTEVPVIIRTASDLEVLELSLIENLQREDLNPIEEAQAYARLAGEFGIRQEDIAQRVGRSRAAVANSMRLPTDRCLRGASPSPMSLAPAAELQAPCHLPSTAGPRSTAPGW